VDYLIQIVELLILAIPVAWASWTVTHEEVFRDLRELCTSKSQACHSFFTRKFFYLFTCEYCFSHWVTLALQFIFQFRMVFDDWRGYFVAFTAMVWVANLYMSLYHQARVDLRKERAIADRTEKELQERKAA
jgi:hypothetical protein